MWNLFKINNKNTRTTSGRSFWCLYCWFWKYFTGRSGVFIIAFEQVKFTNMIFLHRTAEFYRFFPPFLFFKLFFFFKFLPFSERYCFCFFRFLNSFNFQRSFYSCVWFICLIYLSLPNLYFYTIRSFTMFLKVLNQVNFKVLTQT